MLSSIIIIIIIINCMLIIFCLILRVQYLIWIFYFLSWVTLGIFLFSKWGSINGMASSIYNQSSCLGINKSFSFCSMKGTQVTCFRNKSRVFFIQPLSTYRSVSLCAPNCIEAHTSYCIFWYLRSTLCKFKKNKKTKTFCSVRCGVNFWNFFKNWVHSTRLNTVYVWMKGLICIMLLSWLCKVNSLLFWDVKCWLYF